MADIPVIVLAGQSNASFEGVDNRIFELALEQGDAFEFVKVAVGGTSLFPNSYPDWSPSSGELFSDLVSSVNAAIEAINASGHNAVVYTLWVQGEADGVEPRASAYQEALENFIDEYREAIGQPDSAFHIALLPREGKVRLAQLETAAQLDTVHVIEMMGATTWDGIHYDKQTREKLAEDFWKQAEIVIGDVPDYTSTIPQTVVIDEGWRDRVVAAPYLDLFYVGTDRPVRVESFSGDDFVQTGPGADTIITTGNNDEIHAGGGNDFIDAGTHDDLVFAGEGDDIVLGREGADVIHGEGGNDYLRGLAQNDILFGGTGADILEGGDGNDILDGGSGADFMFGGLGNDIYFVDNVNDVIGESDTEGVDEIRTTLNTYAINGLFENLTFIGAGNFVGTANRLDNRMVGGSGNDVLSGLGGNDTLMGLDGNDILDGGSGADFMFGGLGNDIYFVDNVNDVIGESDTEGVDEIRTTLNTYAINGLFENLTFIGAGNFVGTANRLDNRMVGGSGNDVLSGLGGNDTLMGLDGNDILDGGSGADFMFGGLGADTFIIDAGGDTIQDFELSHDAIDLAKLYSSYGLSSANFSYIGNEGFSGIAGELRYDSTSTGSVISGDLNGDGFADFSVTLQGIVDVDASFFLFL